ncbi:GNAT family N-acetyltransferase [Lyngbya confervoides]|uniref:GNAT family N-acetyltransferase n=1 Tax=Lyngbya confervoides BDU141951 TaxID=1574623 RepID=A0ABD4T815_9CYAN|nr:GNAT family N-acetyltransferase [Lyngbya confervoides]MCM1984613.1 GNAT family N-acetyltransferase [Lyngbya confervoides BDU141951]
MYKRYHEYLIRDWTPGDRAAAADLIGRVLAEYHLGWEPQGADQDVVQVEQAYHAANGQFWVVERSSQLVGTAAFLPLGQGKQRVEIRKMYLETTARGQGLGQFLLTQLETEIQQAGYHSILVETASVLQEAVALYEKNGYQPYDQVETQRCDRAYVKYL